MVEDENKYLIEVGSVLKKQPPVLDCVSRQAVIDIINKPVIIRAKEQIEALPSVQPEIIRCKDCIRYGRDDCFMKIQMLWELKPDDYCSYAERRSDETN